MARCSYMHNRIRSNLEAYKDFWKEMRNLGLIPKTNYALHGFSLDEINSVFSKIFISSTEDPLMPLNIINNSSPEGFIFREVAVNEVILAVSHFSSQAKGNNEIPQCAVAKALPTIALHLTKIFNASLSL